MWPTGAPGGFVNLHGVTFQNNLINHISFNSVFMGFTKTTTVLGNTFIDNHPVGLFGAGTTDIIIGPSVRCVVLNVTMQFSYNVTWRYIATEADHIAQGRSLC